MTVPMIPPDVPTSPPTAASDAGLRQYLAARPAWGPILAAATKRYRTNNGLRGEITLTDTAQREVVRGINARLLGRGADRVAVQELDRAFREETRFRMPLVDVLRVYHGRPVWTKDQTVARADAAWAAFQSRVVAAVGTTGEAQISRVSRWFAADERYLRNQRPEQAQEVNDSWGDVEAGTIVAARALAIIDGLVVPIALPVLAQQAAGHPHGLDPDTPAGRLLERALVHTSSDTGLTLPLADAEERELLLSSGNVAVDDISSNVHVYHLLGDDPMLSGARTAGHVLTLSLATIGRLGTVGAAGAIAFVVENPSVFSTLVTVVASLPPDRRPTLVCTSGQLSLAARRLLEMLVASGAGIRYGGDFDHMGLAIARGIMNRGRGRVILWRMGPEDYRIAVAACCSGVTPPRRLDPARMTGLTSAFPDLVPEMLAHGPAFQEALLKALEEDLLAFGQA